MYPDSGMLDSDTVHAYNVRKRFNNEMMDLTTVHEGLGFVILEGKSLWVEDTLREEGEVPESMELYRKIIMRVIMIIIIKEKSDKNVAIDTKQDRKGRCFYCWPFRWPKVKS